MKSTSIYFIIILSIGLIYACSEQKETVSEPETNTSKNEIKTGEDMSNNKSKMINNDGTINATLNCEGTSTIDTLIINGQKMIPSNFTCIIINSAKLSIIFENEDGILTLELYEAGSYPIQTGNYEHMTKGTDSYAIVHYRDKTNGQPNNDLTLDIFDGHVTIIDYGMSSNILCGSFEISDNEGNIFHGKFNEPVTSF